MHVNTIRFEQLIEEYLRGDRDSVKEELGDTLYALAKVVYLKYHFIKDKDEAIQSGAIACLLTLDKFDASRGSALNFFYRIIKNEWCRKYKHMARDYGLY